MANGSYYYGSRLPDGAAPCDRKACSACGCNSCQSETGVCPDCGCVEQSVPGIPSNLGAYNLQYASLLQYSDPKDPFFVRGW